MAITVTDLNIGILKDRQTTRLVKDLSFAVDEGETLAIVGESGSGKSITALSLMGLLTSWNAASSFVLSGTMRLSGESEQVFDLASATERDYDRIRGSYLSMIFQNPWTALNPITSIGNQLVESISAHNPIVASVAQTRAIELMERVGIPQPAAKFHNYPHQLSGGQLQRIMIAMALSGHPRFLIADEPTTALDVTVQRGILRLLDDLRRDGMGIILITHDLSVVAAHSDRIAVMYDGLIVEYGASREVIFNPRHPYTHLLVSSVPTLDVEPGSRLVTKADVLSGRAPGFDGGRFDPEQSELAELTQVSENHFVSSVFVGMQR